MKKWRKTKERDFKNEEEEEDLEKRSNIFQNPHKSDLKEKRILQLEFYRDKKKEQMLKDKLNYDNKERIQMKTI